MTFIRYNDKYKVKPTSKTPQGKFSIHLEEQKLPPMGDQLVIKSARVVPMLSSEWQAVQHLEERDKPAGDSKFRWDGRFAENPRVMGGWSLITEVAGIAEFDPAAKATKVRNPLFSSITFRKGGLT
ncbi:MAG: hypothetical protein GWO24_14265, partial [Akkermansiaceae bacterium]|nr:hypothetical protein [Akkermansiaceae bacterium]